jgi:ATP-dependent Clp protease adapter protein ClpS
MNLITEIRNKSFNVMTDDGISMDAVPEQVVSLYNAREIAQEYAIAVLQQYTGMDYKSAKSLMEQMDDYMNHPEHKPQGEDPGY